jgi:dihydrofolate synthase / folylpolyglutamate synthase
VNPDEAFAWLDRSARIGVKLGLANTLALLEALGDPRRGLRFLHVAGTNGKGSVCAMMDAVLRRAGLRTGLFTSPHLMDFRERIRVDGAMIPVVEAAAGLTRIRQAAEENGINPTYFEIGAVLAIDHFARSSCDVAILETGMGGRLDSTNVAMPLVAVVTPVAMDHAEWLGATPAAIAVEKAGIIKPGAPLVTPPQSPDVAAVLRGRAEACGVPVFEVAQPWDGPVGLAGVHQRMNAATAARALEVAFPEIPRTAIREGIAGVRWPGRFDRVGNGLVVDGAHNPAAIEALVHTWREEFGGEPAAIVFGALADKDASSMIEALRGIAASFDFVPVSGTRAADARGFPRPDGMACQVHGSLEAGLAAARARGPRILATGSLHLAGEVLVLSGAGVGEG